MLINVVVSGDFLLWCVDEPARPPWCKPAWNSAEIWGIKKYIKL